MSRRLLCKALAILLFGMLAVPFALRADQKPGWPGKWELYVAPGAVVFESAPGTALERSETGFAGVAGVGLTDRVSVELLFADIDMAFSGPDGAGSDDTSLLWLDLLYRLPGRAGWQPFVLFGGGATRNDLGNSGLDKYDDTQFNAGVGLFYRLTDRFSLRADLRANYSNDQNDLQPFAFLGLTAFLGGSAGARRADTDGDGVADGRDRCPGTPVSRTVDGDGCEPDRDGDGVADAADVCPATPGGTAVDARGCSLDGDGDGVADHMDQCPDSDVEARVDERGCYLELQETVTLDLNLEFDSNSAELRPDHFGLIDPVVRFLREYPTASAIIEGHTDSDGSQSYNQVLSERRAAAVSDYLVVRGGINPARLRSLGYGETRPVASNDTTRGKQRNRRVSAVISGTQTVRE